MGIRVVWADDNRSILRIDYEANWTLDEMAGTLEGLRELLDAADKQVGLLIHHTDAGISAAAASRLADQLDTILPHTRCGMVVVVGAQGTTRATYEGYAQLRHDLHFANTFDAGYDLIRGK